MSPFSRIEERAAAAGYSISESGKIISPHSGEISGWINTEGRIVFRPVIGDTSCAASRLMAYQKYGDKIYEPGIGVRHLDGNCRNNSHQNIEIGTHSQNMMDIPPDRRLSHAILASKSATKHNHSVVLDFYRRCKSYAKTMMEFGITSKGTLNSIIHQSILSRTGPTAGTAPA